MEEDIQNHSPTVMFRGTPCSKPGHKPRPINKKSKEMEIS